MKLRRIGRAFPWRNAFILVLPLCFAALSSWAWFTWELPPIQQYYLRAYWDSSKTANEPKAVVEIRWLELTAPGRKSEWPLNSDVTDDPFGYSPAILSYQALSKGWTGIEESPPNLVRSSELRNILCTCFYSSRDFSQVVNKPVLYACFALFLTLLLAWKMRDSIGYEWRELWRVVWEPESVWDLGCNIPPYEQTNLGRTWNRIARRFATLNLKPERFRFWANKRRFLSADLPVEARGVSGHDLPSFNADDLERSTEPRISSTGSAAPTNTQPNTDLVFPGSSPSYIPSKDANAWHESEWIE